MKRLIALLILLSALLPHPAGALQVAAAEPTLVDPWFDDAVILGDSVTRQLHSLVLKERKAGKRPLSEVTFITAHNYMIYNASRKNLGSNEVNLRYRGKDYTFEGLLKELKPRKLFLMLGLNDGARKNPEKQMRYFEQTMDIAFSVVPDMLLVIQSLSPVTEKQKAASLQQPNIDAFNETLKALCEEKGAVFLDIATPLKGPDGLLPLSLSSDTKVHLNEEGLLIWMNTLRQFAFKQMNKENPEE